MVAKISMVMMGGAVGAVTRYGFSLFAARYFGTRYPWGTLLANMTGCLLIGITFALADRTNLLSPQTRLFFMTGFLGSLTTFSAYALETVHYLREGSYVAVVNFLINNLLGGFLVLTGIWMVHFALKGR